MVVTYTTGTHVANLLQLGRVFTTTTIPTVSEVERIINRKEDFIDNKTGHAWRTTTITQEYVIPNRNYTYGTGVKFKLSHRKIKNFNSDSGDKIEVWDGSSWVDYVATTTEGRANNYWADYTNGIVFIMDRRGYFENGVRFTYRYGDTIVDKTVEDIATKLAAIDVLTNYDLNVNFVEDGATTRLTDNNKIDIWTKQVDEELGELQEFTII